MLGRKSANWWLCELRGTLNIGKHSKYRPSDDEIGFIDIYVTLKRNRKIFLSAVIFTFLCSVFVAYIKCFPNPPSEKTTVPKIEYSLWLEIGKLYAVNSPRRLLLDNPNNAVEKLKNIYVQKAINEFGKSGIKGLSLSSVSVDTPKKSKLTVLKIIGDEKSSKSYEEVLNIIANHLLEEHKSKFDVKDNIKVKLQPTRILQQFKKRIPSADKKNILFLIPLLGIIFGVFVGFLAIFVKDFFAKVKQAEESRETVNKKTI
jgi:hypothetical protein